MSKRSSKKSRYSERLHRKKKQLQLFPQEFALVDACYLLRMIFNFNKWWLQL